MRKKKRNPSTILIMTDEEIKETDDMFMGLIERSMTNDRNILELIEKLTRLATIHGTAIREVDESCDRDIIRLLEAFAALRDRVIKLENRVGVRGR
jgi:hypothetical protein